MEAREFAVTIVRKLQDAGFEGLWAGGCVRDQLLGKTPKDYDVATNATPEQVRQLFGKRNTIAIGASFGVITVIGSKQSGNIEVATFRRDAEYSDGRRPDAVEFTDAREDALRRDFTINGMFFDPIHEKLIDFVDGKADLECRVIRAIGNPEERINEDKLRMLRAVRFAATYDFDLEAQTLQAIQDHANEIDCVSGERIGAEMRRMLAHPNRAFAAELLKESKLLKHILRDGELLYKQRSNWRTRIRWMDQLGDNGKFEQAAFLLLSKLIKMQGITAIAERWKLSNSETNNILWFENNLMTLSRAHSLPWSLIQPLMIGDEIDMAVELLGVQFGRDHEGYKFCLNRLNWDDSRLDPAPLMGGNDLTALKIPPGPLYSIILARIRAAQLDQELESKDQARELAMEIYRTHQEQSQ